MPIITALGRLRLEGCCDLEVSMGYRGKPSKNQTYTKTNWNKRNQKEKEGGRSGEEPLRRH